MLFSLLFTSVLLEYFYHTHIFFQIKFRKQYILLLKEQPCIIKKDTCVFLFSNIKFD